MSNETLPDHSTCVHCGVGITWDEWSYVHDDSHFADCGIIKIGGNWVDLPDGTKIHYGYDIRQISGVKTVARPVEMDNA